MSDADDSAALNGQQAVDSTQPADSGVPDSTVVIRRGQSATRLLPMQSVAETTVVSRNVLHARVTKKPETSRARKIAGDLPDWEPLPPGELLVHRGQ
jgi:hypothetical protein